MGVSGIGEMAMRALVAVIAVAVIFANVSAEADNIDNSIVPEEFTQTAVAMEKSCSINVQECFAHIKRTDNPVWKKPVSDYSGSYKTMCAPEVKVKVAKKDAKIAAEKKHKELCKKSEANGKVLKKQLDLSRKKEKYSKAVAEGKQKYLEKKVKSAEEMTVKTAGKGKEFADKAAEKANKSEYILYKKECHSKETAFKAVREGKQKVKIVYVSKLPKPKPQKKKHHKKKPKKSIKKILKKFKKHIKKKEIKKAIKKVKKAMKQLKAQKPHKKVVKKVVKHHKVSSLREVLIKTKEGSDKASAKSAELVRKSNLSGKEAVAKEQIQKSHHNKKKHTGEKKDKKEAAHKKKLAAETKAKSEIEQKLAVEKVKKKLTLKEIAHKKEAPPPKKKKCNPVSSLEKYVKKCKLHEGKFAKSKRTNEINLKEVKKKAKYKLEELKCSVSRRVCKKIYEVSNIRGAKIAHMVDNHNQELQAALSKTEKFEAAEAMKMKYNICESAAKDMKYFSNKFLYGPIAQAATVAKAVGKHKAEAQA